MSVLLLVVPVRHRMPFPWMSEGGFKALVQGRKTTPALMFFRCIYICTAKGWFSTWVWHFMGMKELWLQTNAACPPQTQLGPFHMSYNVLGQGLFLSVCCRRALILSETFSVVISIKTTCNVRAFVDCGQSKRAIYQQGGTFVP